jgi:hypothetical protein
VGGNQSNAEIAAALRAMADRLDRIEANTRSNNEHSANSADSLRSMNRNGVMVYTDPTEPLKAQVVA